MEIKTYTEKNYGKKSLANVWPCRAALNNGGGGFPVC